jgi:hypothetical protein
MMEIVLFGKTNKTSKIPAEKHTVTNTEEFAWLVQPQRNAILMIAQRTVNQETNVKPQDVLKLETEDHSVAEVQLYVTTELNVLLIVAIMFLDVYLNTK